MTTYGFEKIGEFLDNLPRLFLGCLGLTVVFGVVMGAVGYAVAVAVR